jgi:hypothetical protein
MAAVRCRPDIASRNADNISFSAIVKTDSAETRRLKSLAYIPNVDEYIDEG